MPPLLSDDEARAALEQVPGWRREGDAIVRDLECADFAAAIAFVNRVAEAAEGLDHHPDILVHGWNKVRLTSSTHSDGGLTAKDFALAAAVDALPAT
jgi:4a-hydroxytetrahydrobiopterin dehydratase